MGSDRPVSGCGIGPLCVSCTALVPESAEAPERQLACARVGVFSRRREGWSDGGTLFVEPLPDGGRVRREIRLRCIVDDSPGAGHEAVELNLHSEICWVREGTGPDLTTNGVTTSGEAMYGFAVAGEATSSQMRATTMTYFCGGQGPPEYKARWNQGVDRRSARFRPEKYAGSMAAPIGIRHSVGPAGVPRAPQSSVATVAVTASHVRRRDVTEG